MIDYIVLFAFIGSILYLGYCGLNHNRWHCTGCDETFLTEEDLHGHVGPHQKHKPVPRG